ncbi:hypothetical protein GALMADRAFT_145910 [Galerina marginata CBS 339.88]|uniref:Uncharacterized protein n=1 Tax=Galerina marginata (strain CBS 339.88) TaxID=685588 RepID=A0A067SMF5_GALM3|nr:hypothetical protein GALMADRAFT_145910 [Galerina marginata CBS 339.88]
MSRIDDHHLNRAPHTDEDKRHRRYLQDGASRVYICVPQSTTGHVPITLGAPFTYFHPTSSLQLPSHAHRAENCGDVVGGMTRNKSETKRCPSPPLVDIDVPLRTPYLPLTHPRAALLLFSNAHLIYVPHFSQNGGHSDGCASNFPRIAEQYTSGMGMVVVWDICAAGCW